MLVRLHLLLPLALACRRETLGRGDVFRCDAELSALVFHAPVFAALLWMDEILHHFSNHGQNHDVCWSLQKSSNQGF